MSLTAYESDEPPIRSNRTMPSPATTTATALTSSASPSSTAQAFCLRWNNFQSNLLNVFERLFLDERFVDVTLACEGQLIKAHQMILSASSSYFQEIFSTTPCTHPVVIMKDVPLKDLRKILEFMYKGEINVNKQEIASLLVVAEALHVRGLAHIESQNDNEPQPSASSTSMSSATNTLNDCRKTAKLNRLLKRPITRESSMESLILIDDDANTTMATHPPKQCRLSNDNGHCANSTVNTAQDIQLIDDTTTAYELHETTEDFMEPQTEYDAHEFDGIAIEAVQVKHEHDDDIIGSFSTNNGNLQGFHWMDPSAHCLSSDISEVAVKSKRSDTTASSSSTSKLKAPSWTADQLREAIESVVRQKMRFTQASMKYNIPKGTLYDNILGKSNRMEVLAKSGLNANDENAVLEFCCDLSVSPYNRRTRKPLSEILNFVHRLDNCNHQVFDEGGRFAYRWWWAFCKKYSIVSLHYDNNASIKMNQRN